MVHYNNNKNNKCLFCIYMQKDEITCNKIK